MLLSAAAFLAAGAAMRSQRAATQRTETTLQKRNFQSTKASQHATGRKIPCKTPQNASLCYWTHGRLAVYNGDPSARIWKIGTRRVLGVFSGPSHFPPRTAAEDETPELPLNLGRVYESDYRRWKQSDAKYYEFPLIFADFEVCPLEPEKKGEMQAVCIESATKIVVQKSY